MVSAAASSSIANFITDNQPYSGFMTEWLVYAVIAVLVGGLWRLAWRDGERRGRNGLVVALLVVFGAFPIGLLIWVAMRPPILPPAGGAGDGFDLDQFRVQ